MKFYNLGLSFLWCLSLLAAALADAEDAVYPVDSFALEGGDKKGHIVFTATLGDAVDKEEKQVIYAVDVQSDVRIEGDVIKQRSQVVVALKHGTLKEVDLGMVGDVEVESVEGAHVQFWSLQRPLLGAEQEAYGQRLIVHLQEPVTEGRVDFVVRAKRVAEEFPLQWAPLFLIPDEPHFLSGKIELSGGDDFELLAQQWSALQLHTSEDERRLSYTISSAKPSLLVQAKRLLTPEVVVEDFALQGSYEEGRFRFVLTGLVDVVVDREQELPLLSGRAALTAAPEVEGGEVFLREGQYVLGLPGKGSYRLRIAFDGAVSVKNSLREVRFDLLPSALQPVVLSGLPAASDRIHLNGVSLELQGEQLHGSLAGNGAFHLTWSDATWQGSDAADAALFYSASNTAHVLVSSGSVWQRHDLRLKIMQGQMNRVVFDLSGEGEILRVVGEGILRWEVQEEAGRAMLVLDLNQDYEEDLVLRVISQSVMKALPAQAQPLRLLPRDAIQYTGFVRILNKGAVSIDVFDTKGFVQISPEHFPAESKRLRGNGQELIYRFFGADYRYQVRADDILPDVSVSQLLLYTVGSEGQSLSVDMELTIRDAPLRDFYMRIPDGYALANLKAKSLADYFLLEDAQEGRQLRLVFSEPVSGRQVIQAELESNRTLEGKVWELPVVQAVGVKNVRGHIGVTVEPGLRAAVDSMTGLSEQAVHFFPKEVPQLQVALRMRDEAWQAALRIEQVPQTIQTDALHLYSVAENRIYGSSVVNYLIAGAPVSEFLLQVPLQMQNLDFAGQDIRGWSELEPGLYQVKLHTPASGAYTLLLTYESPFESEEALVSFVGVRPMGVDSEEGYIVLVSNFPFALGTVEADADLLRLEPNEIPTEFRLLYDAQELAAYQYAARPMNLAVQLRSYVQATGADQVIDFVDLHSHISGDGEILTSVDFMLKSKGQTHFRMQVPPQHRIWSARVAQKKVSPIATDGGILLPLPPGQDPNTAVHMEIELAAQAEDALNPVLYAPAMFAPSLLVNWELSSDAGYALRYVEGDIQALGGAAPSTGFAWLGALLGGELGSDRMALLLMLACGVGALFLMKALLAWRDRLSVLLRVVFVLVMMLCLAVFAITGIAMASEWSTMAAGRSVSAWQDSLTLRTPIELSTEPLRIMVKNASYSELDPSWISFWPFLLGIAVWVFTGVTRIKQNLGWMLGWMIHFVAALSVASDGTLFLGCLTLFFSFHLLRPLLSLWGRPSPASLAAWLLFMLASAGMGLAGNLDAAEFSGEAVAQAVTQNVQVVDDIALVDAELRWVARKNEPLAFLTEAATLLEVKDLPAGIRLVGVPTALGLSYRLDADEAGSYRVAFRYRVPLTTEQSGVSRIALAVDNVLSNQARVDVAEAHVVLPSDSCVTVKELTSLHPERSLFEVVFAAGSLPELMLGSRSRDSREELAVYHVQSFDMFAPASGVVNGYHHHRIRLAQGQVDSLQLRVPLGMTITGVESEHLAKWQFDPEERALLLFYENAQRGLCQVGIFSQYSSGELPYQQNVESLLVEGASSQLGLVALATGEEVQIAEVDGEEVTAINLEDFPAVHSSQLTHLGRVPDIRRAFRWTTAGAALQVKAIPVETDVRVVSKQTFSLGEDRIVLSADMTATINRAGLFRLSVPIPDDYDVESVSGRVLSHWNELKGADGERLLQLHLKAKTIGQAEFRINLAGAGLGERSRFVPPLLKFSQTNRHSGTLIVVPELGYRLTPAERKGALQMDPAEAGMSRQKLMLFRILNEEAALAFTVERVEPWIEVENLQSTTVRSGMIDVKSRFHFTVENAGIREQLFRVPPEAIGVQFSGRGVSDYKQGEEGQWIVMMKSKMVGTFMVELTYQIPMPDQPSVIDIAKAEALHVDQESAYLALLPQGRLQLFPKELGNAWQYADAQTASASLRGDLNVEAASHFYRNVKSGSPLTVDVLRHEIAELVAAQVSEVQLTSVVSSQGAMLTKVTLKLDPGDKRMLRLTLPPQSEFWFGFVNQQGVWPWREGADILLQLEANAIEGQESVVEFFYATEGITQSETKIRARMSGPKLDLPLENIVWDISYPETWQIDEWGGNMRQDHGERWSSSFANIIDYREAEQDNRNKQKEVAETLLNEANALLERGQQEQARQVFNSAYNLSQFDAALNEDARVQLKNVREEQALLALANRRNVFLNDNTFAIQNKDKAFVTVDDDQLLNYTSDMVQGVLDGNSAEENKTLRSLASRLINQQQAVLGNPQSMQTVVPEQGKKVRFSRSLQINDQADLIVEFTGQSNAVGGQARSGFVSSALFLLLLLGSVSYVFRK